MVFGEAPDEALEAGMKMLMECATPATLLGEAEALRHTLRVKWHFRVGEVLNREWCPELTYEEATKQDTDLDKKLRSTIKVTRPQSTTHRPATSLRHPSCVCLGPMGWRRERCARALDGGGTRGGSDQRAGDLRGAHLLCDGEQGGMTCLPWLSINMA